MKKIPVLVLLALLFVQCHSTKKKMEQPVSATGKPAVSKPDKAYIPQDPDVRTGRLANGMTYYIRHNSRPAKKVFMLLPVKVGSTVEDDDQQGLAHFMEHMNFNGTKNFAKNQLVEFLQKMGVRFGADLNAFTSFDKTVYILPIPLDNPENLDKGLLVLHDWAHYATLEPAEIDKERGVVLEEYRLGRGAEERMQRKWWPVLLRGSRYAERLPIGKKQILETFPYDALKRFHKDWYRPDLEAVIVVGDIDPDAVESKIKKLFGEIPATPNPRKREYYNVPDHKETLISVASDPEATFNNVMVVYKDHGNHQPMQTADDYRQMLVENLFLRMLNNRLDDIKDSDNPPFTYASAFHGPFIAMTKDAFVMNAYTSPKKRLAALETFLLEARKAREFGFSAAELERAKKEIMADMEQTYQNRNTTESRNFAWQYQRNFTDREPIPSITWEYNMHKWFLPRIQLGEVNAMGKKFVHDDNRVIVITGLKKEGIPEITEADVRRIIDRTASQKLENQTQKAQKLSLMTGQVTPGTIVDETRNEQLGTVTLRLSNGAIVTYKKTDFKTDEILTGYWKFGGKSLLSTPELKKTAYVYEAIPEAGVNGMDKKTLRKVLAGKKVRNNLGVDDIDSYAFGKVRPKDLDTWFQLNFLEFTKPNFDPKAYASWKKRQAFRVNLANNPQYKFILAASKFMAGKDPRYLPPIPTKELLDQQDYKLAYDKFRHLYFDGASGYHFYFVGNFDEQQLRKNILTYIGGLPQSQNKGQYRKYPDYTPQGKHRYVFHAGTEPKSMVIISQSSPATYNYADARYLKAFGEILTNRLIKEIRENESGVYTIAARARMEKLPHGRVGLVISFPCGPDNSLRLEKNAMKVFRDLLQNGPTAEDLEKIKKAWISQYEKQARENNFWLRYLQDTDYYGYDPSRFDRFRAFVDRMTTGDVKKAAAKYLSRPQSDLRIIWMPENYDDNGNKISQPK